MKQEDFIEKQENIIGSQKWFKKRAIDSLRKIDENTWDYSDSTLAWSPGAMSIYKDIQEREPLYRKNITDKESNLIKNISSEIVSSLPEKCLYIDLGPGTEHKEKFFFDAIKNQGKNILYVPVDINLDMLAIADEYAKKNGFNTYPINQTFEDLPMNLQKLPRLHRFVSLGLTFINYEPQKGLEILKRITDQKGTAFITVQLRDRIDINAIRKTYEDKDTQELFLKKIELLGLNPTINIQYVEVTNDVFVYYTIKNIPDNLKTKGLKNGDRLLTLRSYRHSYRDLKEILEKDFKVKYFDRNSEFLAITIKFK